MAQVIAMATTTTLSAWLLHLQFPRYCAWLSQQAAVDKGEDSGQSHGLWEARVLPRGTNAAPSGRGAALNWLDATQVEEYPADGRKEAVRQAREE